MNFDAKIPSGPLSGKWGKRKFEGKLVNPANKRKYKIIVVGAGLAGGGAAASLGELGYQVDCFCFQDSPRRAHSIAAQGGINAAKNYQNDGDSVYRLFYDTIKGGDFRSREANVYRLAEVSAAIIDQCVAMGVPFAREYGGVLANRWLTGGILCWGLAAVCASYAIWAPQGNLRPYQLAVILLFPLVWVCRRLGGFSGTSRAP